MFLITDFNYKLVCNKIDHKSSLMINARYHQSQIFVKNLNIKKLN